MAGFVEGPVTVSVPATSANLGPGFDALGLALDLRDRVTAEVVGSRLEIEVVGEGAASVPRDAAHLVHRAIVRGFGALGSPVPQLRIWCDNRIPHGRGLGSSAAAIVAGVWLARGLVLGADLLMDDDDSFALAAEIEGHPDNVAAATYGGLAIAYRDDSVRAITAPVDPRVQPVVFVAPEPLQTSLARELLPGRVRLADAARNAGRAALLVAALAGRPELLLAATEDRLHQDAREPAMPATLGLVRALRADGVAAVVSGAGPSVLALTDRGSVTALTDRCPAGWTVLAPPVSGTGALLLVDPA